jgi:hypothetical protein
MPRKLITCPETAHLEDIEYEHTPLGMVIVSCSRFAPDCEPRCARLCAARLDARERLHAAVDPAEWLEEHGAAVDADDADTE